MGIKNINKHTWLRRCILAYYHKRKNGHLLFFSRKTNIMILNILLKLYNLFTTLHIKFSPFINKFLFKCKDITFGAEYVYLRKGERYKSWRDHHRR